MLLGETERPKTKKDMISTYAAASSVANGLKLGICAIHRWVCNRFDFYVDLRREKKCPLEFALKCLRFRWAFGTQLVGLGKFDVSSHFQREFDVSSDLPRGPVNSPLLVFYLASV